MFLSSLLWCSIAFADAEADLVLAADSKAIEATRLEAFNRLVRLGGTDLRHVLSVAGDSNQEMRLRWVAIRVLGQVGGDPALNLLPTVIQDKHPSIRAAVCAALGDLRSKSHAKLVGKRLQDKAIIVRAAAAAALGQMRSTEGIAPLGLALVDKSNWHRNNSLWVRRHYVAALERIGHKKAYPILLRTLDDSDPTVVAAVIAAVKFISGNDFSEGRSSVEEIEAWRRWLTRQLGR